MRMRRSQLWLPFLVLFAIPGSTSTAATTPCPDGGGFAVQFTIPCSGDADLKPNQTEGAWRTQGDCPSEGVC